MINGKTVLAIIPARGGGGSNRLPRKNVSLLAGKPLIVWTIEAGLKSNFIDKLIVSFDNKNILNISQETGVEIIVRPEELATDEASTFSVIIHLVKRIKEDYDFTVLLQPTSPLRNENHIDEAFKLLLEKKADAVMSVCKTSHNPLWSNVLPEDGSMWFIS